MKRALVLLAVLVCVSLSGLGAAAPPSPPPNPMVPPTGDPGSQVPSVPALPVEEPPTPKPAAAPKAAAKKKAAKPPTIRLEGEKRETDNSDWQGAGQSPAGKTTVKASGATLTATLAAQAYSHSFFGVPSYTGTAFELAQEFEVVPGDPKAPLVRLTLSGTLKGFFRSEGHGASAGLRVADAAIYPACDGPPVWIALPPFGVPEDQMKEYEQEAPATSVVLPAGRFLLVAHLGLETTAGGFLRSHAESIFAAGRRVGTWTSHNVQPPEGEGEGYGLTVTLKAAAAPSK